MKLHNGMEINKNGHLTISGCDTVELAKQYSTPLYVVDENLLRTRCRQVKSAMNKYFDRNRVMYASKALNTKAILKICAQEGLGIDTVSAGELYTALSAGIAPEMIELHGNSKTEEEIVMAVENQIYMIIADTFEELEFIEEVCQRLGKKIKVSIRLRPNIDIHAHEAIQTAKMDCKFGFGIIDGQALAAAKIIAQSKNMILHGIHCHIGSQIFEEEPFRELAEHLVSFALEVKKETGVTVSEFNCGGGYGVYYTEKDTPIPVERFVKIISESIKSLCAKADFPLPIVSVEPGRFIIGEAGTTLYTVNSLKEIKDVRTYCNVDGGMFENVRTALYQAQYTAVCANKMDKEHLYPVSIAGKCCESGDMITWNTPMPKLEKGDTLAVLTTGAYNYSMASNYNRNAVPALVLVNNGKSALAVKRQTYEYITANDVIPEYLK